MFSVIMKVLFNEEIHNESVENESVASLHPTRAIHLMKHFCILYVSGFQWSVEVYNVRRVYLKPQGSNYRRVGCRMFLLELFKSIGVYNGHEWVLVIGQDAYATVLTYLRKKCASASRAHIHHGRLNKSHCSPPDIC